MSAKPSKKGANKPASSPTPADAAPRSEPASITPVASGDVAATAPAGAAQTSWLDSSDPKKRLWGQIIFVGVWIYVAALWLLALDQTFNWGLFGPKVPPVA